MKTKNKFWLFDRYKHKNRHNKDNAALLTRETA